jgi:CBS domain-containing protein
VVHEGRLVGIVSERDFVEISLELFDDLLAQDERRDYT